MPKVIETGTTSPYKLTMGNGVYLDDAAIVTHQLNYAFGYHSGLHLSVATGPAAWGGSGTVPAHNALFPSGLSSELMYHFYSWVDADVEQIHIEVEATVASGHTCDVLLAVGGSSTTLNATVGTAYYTADVATSSTGTGWILIKITFQHVSGGSSTANHVSSILLEDVAQTTAASIRDPEA